MTQIGYCTEKEYIGYINDSLDCYHYISVCLYTLWTDIVITRLHCVPGMSSWIVRSLLT